MAEGRYCCFIAFGGRKGHVGWACAAPTDFWLRRFSWYLLSNGYVARREGDLTVLMHRQILGLLPRDGHRGDHINGNRLDNRRSNLRVANASLNGQNRLGLEARNTSGYRGVTFDKTTRCRHKWRAQATLDGHNRTIGRFATADEAGVAAAEWRAVHMPFSQEALCRSVS